MADSTDGRDQELENWYDQTHIPEMLSVPGVVSARRLGLVGRGGDAGLHRIVTVYDVETDDLASLQRELLEHGRGFHLSNAFDHSTPMVGWYEALGPTDEGR